MPKPKRQGKYDFLHVLEGGKTGQHSESATKGKTARQPALKPGSTTQKSATGKRKSGQNRAGNRGRRIQIQQGGIKPVLSKTAGFLVQGLILSFKLLSYPVKICLTGLARLRQETNILPYLIITASAISVILLAYGSHLLVEKRSAQSINRLMEIRAGLTAGNIENLSSQLLENPWSRRTIKVHQGDERNAMIVMEGINGVGCEKIAHDVLPHFHALSINGLAINHNQEIRKACSLPMNTLALLMTH